jgi:hypothetical protein
MSGKAPDRFVETAGQKRIFGEKKRRLGKIPQTA